MAISEKLKKCKQRLLDFCQYLENKNDSASMKEFITDEFQVLAEELDFLNVFNETEKTLLLDNNWRLDKNDLGQALMEDYLKSESIVKDDNQFLYSLFDEQNDKLVIESMPFVYLENLLNYRNTSLTLS